MEEKRVIIIGAAGRDFHNFNVYFRGKKGVRVAAFTAAQIPGIDDRVYPAALAGPDYPDGIPIHPEAELGELIVNLQVDEVIFSYSDVTYHKVMELAAIALANGADFRLISPYETMIKSTRPVVAVCATRTGCGKSQTTRAVVKFFKDKGLRVVSIRHPMPYGDLVKQRVQRFATIADLTLHKCTIEEAEEYEPHVAMGSVIFSGVDYEAILREAEKEADVIIWDGGNNDSSFYKPDLLIVVADALRPGHELNHYPGDVNFLTANVIIINKINGATTGQIEEIIANARRLNPKATIIKAKSPVTVDKPELIRGQRVLAVEDGPSCTHGDLPIGAGTAAAKQLMAQLVDPRPYLAGSLRETFVRYPNIGPLLPAMGYDPEQVADLQQTIQNMLDVKVIDTVVIGTPIDLGRIIKISAPCARVTYSLEEVGHPTIADILDEKIMPLIQA